MNTAIEIAGGLIALAAFVAYCMKVARQDDETDDDIQAPEAEIDCHATSIWIGGNHFEI